MLTYGARPPPPLQVYKPRGMKLWVMWIVGVSMFCVALAATTGSVYTMIDSLRHVTWFE